MCPRAGMEAVKKGKIFAAARNQSPVLQFVE
jgi:hypothetical protein